MASVRSNSKAGHPSIVLDEQGRPQVRAFRCSACEAVIPEQTIACRSCSERGATVPFDVRPTGTLHAWSVVHRSYPGVAVPFISAIVDLDDGLTLKGTLRHADPDALAARLRVRLEFDDAGGATDKDGMPYVGFHFIPSEDQDR